MWPVSDGLVSVPVLALVTTAEEVLGHWIPRAEGLNMEVSVSDVPSSSFGFKKYIKIKSFSSLQDGQESGAICFPSSSLLGVGLVLCSQADALGLHIFTGNRCFRIVLCACSSCCL